MEVRATGTAGGNVNALRRELATTVSANSAAPAEVVYGLLADLSTHLVWAGERQSKKTRLTALSAPSFLATVGTEFTSIGADPMGEFHDRSVVTEATSATLFEFVTEAHLATKKGKMADWTNVHRYEITPTDRGSQIFYSIRIVRISALPGMLAVFNIPILSGLGMKAAAQVARRGVTNLATTAETSH